MKHKPDDGDAFLLVTGDSPNLDLLIDTTLLSNVLKTLPTAVNMHALIEPIITEAYANPGLEGYVAIDASKITISTYTINPRFVADVHSCNDFDYHSVLAYLKRKFCSRNIAFLYCHESDFKSEEVIKK